MGLNDWFEWNGKRCTDYGIRVLEQPPITLPAERSEFKDVLGRSGSLAVLEGKDVYDDLTLTAKCYVADTTRLNEISKYLKGSGKVTFANRPGGFYNARVINQIPFEQIVRGRPQRTFAVNFRCAPFWYQDGVEDMTFTEAQNTVTNPGTVFSQPKITVYGSGDVLLTVAGQVMQLVDIDEGIILDTELQDALSLDGAALRNDHVAGDFLTFAPGYNVLAWLADDDNDNAGTVTKIVVSPRWRYL